MPSRSGAIDSVRVLGIAAVVAGHTLSSPLVRPLFFTWHVPLFFFLAGYFWSAGGTVREELAKRGRTLGLPGGTWMLLMALLFVPLDALLENFSASRLLGPISNGVNSPMPYTTLWFVSALFFTVVLLRLLWRLPPVVIGGVAVGGLALGYVAGNTLAQTPLSIGSALPCLSFVLLGTLAKKLRPRIGGPFRIGLLLILVAAALIGTGVAAPLDIKQGDYGTPVLSAVVAVAISFGLVLVAEAAFACLPESIGRLATRLAYAGFTVVLIHPLFIWLMVKFVWPVPDWLIFLIALIVPWIVGLLSLRTPASAWLTGTERRRTAPVAAA